MSEWLTMKNYLIKTFALIFLLFTTSLSFGDDVNYLREAISNISEGIIEGRAGDADDMLEYLQNARDYAISAQANHKNKHIKIAIHHLNSAISHASQNDLSGATKDAGLALLHLDHVKK